MGSWGECSLPLIGSRRKGKEEKRRERKRERERTKERKKY
jgi:hypothetical protein